MKKILALFCLGVILLLDCSLLTGCQNTASGFNRDMDKNVDAMRREINS